MLRIFEVKKGKHDFWPVEFRSIWRLRNFGLLRYEVVFDKSCEYILPGEDQGDFNKGGGVSFDAFSNTKNAALWGWRHTPGAGIDLTGYFHENGERQIGIPEQLVAMTVQPGERVFIEVWRAFFTWKVTFVRLNADGEGIAFAEHERTFKRSFALGYRVGLWFGGNQPAPQGMQVWADVRKE